MYVPVTSWSGGEAQGVSAHPIFTVGAGSRFYSPFWRMIYVEVPDGVATVRARDPRRQVPAAPSPRLDGGADAARRGPGRDACGAIGGRGDGNGLARRSGSAVRRNFRPSAVRHRPRRRSDRGGPDLSLRVREGDGTWVAPTDSGRSWGRASLFAQTPAPVERPGGSDREVQTPTGACTTSWCRRCACVRAVGIGDRRGPHARRPVGQRDDVRIRRRRSRQRRAGERPMLGTASSSIEACPDAADPCRRRVLVPATTSTRSYAIETIDRRRTQSCGPT